MSERKKWFCLMVITPDDPKKPRTYRKGSFDTYGSINDLAVMACVVCGMDTAYAKTKVSQDAYLGDINLEEEGGFDFLLTEDDEQIYVEVSEHELQPPSSFVVVNHRCIDQKGCYESRPVMVHTSREDAELALRNVQDQSHFTIHEVF